jgi:hypothetical protein
MILLSHLLHDDQADEADLSSNAFSSSPTVIAGVLIGLYLIHRRSREEYQVKLEQYYTEQVAYRDSLFSLGATRDSLLSLPKSQRLSIPLSPLPFSIDLVLYLFHADLRLFIFLRHPPRRRSPKPACPKRQRGLLSATRCRIFSLDSFQILMPSSLSHPLLHTYTHLCIPSVSSFGLVKLLHLSTPRIDLDLSMDLDVSLYFTLSYAWMSR